uniref:Putative 2-aminoethanethiol cysteamine dioxygenase b n=1 Tax=Triatoma infestans TaxID=30076 RepID=A0A023F8R6_TRIIF
MEAIKRQALATFRNHNGFEENLSVLISLMNKLTSNDVNLDHRLLNNPVGNNWAPVTYVGILDNEHFTISMFVLRQGSKLPLHDHPLMHGVCKVVHGKVRMRNFSFIGDPLSTLVEGTVMVTRDGDREVTATDPAVVLSPTRGNIHEISALDGPAAFVDVLAPPYKSLIVGYGPRPCHYYLELDSEGEDAQKLIKIADHPEYWTDIAPYLGP